MHRLTLNDKTLIDQAGEVLAQAFYEDPAWLWVFPDPDIRAKAVDFLERRILRMHVPLGQCWVTLDSAGERVLVAAVWRPPRRKLGMLTYIRHGLAWLPFKYGLGAFRRMMHAEAVMKAIKRRHALADACWFLDTLGVAPAAQGRGLGSESLREVLQDVVDPSRLPATLFTSKPANLPFYERADFEVLQEERVGGEDGFVLWYMARPVPG